MANTCQDCKNWKYDPDGNHYSYGDPRGTEGWGECLAFPCVFGHPRGKGEPEIIKRERATLKAAIHCSDAWDCYVETRYDFGCNLFEPKEE